MNMNPYLDSLKGTYLQIFIIFNYSDVVQTPLIEGVPGVE